MSGAGKATISISCFGQMVFIEKVMEATLFATKAKRSPFWGEGNKSIIGSGGKHTETHPKLFVFFLFFFRIFFQEGFFTRVFCVYFFLDGLVGQIYLFFFACSGNLKKL